jgi:hypothetical protein
MRPALSARPRRALCALTAVTVTTALGLAVAGSAQAVEPAWSPADWAMPYLPAPAVDGEITVASISNTDASYSEAVSFTRTGTPVLYDTRASAAHAQWSPGGDVLATRPTGFNMSTSPSPYEVLYTAPVGNKPLWSPYGDTKIAVVKRADSDFVQVATWVGALVSDPLTTPVTTDRGAGAPTPYGDALVVTVGTAGSRDLSVVDTVLPRVANKALLPPASAGTPLGYGELDAHDAVVSPDGTLAFVGASDKGPAVFVDEGTGPVAVASLGADCPGQRPGFSPSGGSLAYLASSPDCASTTLHVLDRAAGSFVSGNDTVVTTSPDGDKPRHFSGVSWRAKTPVADSRRLGGSDRVSTGIQVSRFGWTDGSEGAVLASSESFPDALVAGPLAGAAGMPLLINPKAKLDSRVLAELKRLMPDPSSRFVYIVGGTGVVSNAVQSALGSNGFEVVRLAGTNRFATSVAVAKELDLGFQGSGLPRTTAFLADGTTFPDALSAGPAASVFFAPTLLTNGRSIPDSVKAYVNGRTSITRVNAVGGNAAAVVGAFDTRAGDRVFGADRFATSVQVAKTYFPGAATAGYASGTTFPDALTGGALMAAMWQPLMLVEAGRTPSAVGSQAVIYRSATDQVLTFGGTAVVHDTVRADLARLAGTQTALYGPTTPLVENPDFPTLRRSISDSATEPGPTVSTRERNPAPATDRGEFRTPAHR